MGYRRLATVECSTLHQSFLLPECEARGAQGSDRVGCVAFHRSGRRNNLRLRTRIFRLLLQEKRLPMHGMPHKDGSRSPEEENDSAQTELVMRTPVNEAGSQGQAAEHLETVCRCRPRKNTVASARAYSHQRSYMPDWHLCIVRQDYNLAAALCERLRHGSIAPFIPLRIEVTT
jgi:hypothetical protein